MRIYETICMAREDRRACRCTKRQELTTLLVPSRLRHHFGIRMATSCEPHHRLEGIAGANQRKFSRAQSHQHDPLRELTTPHVCHPIRKHRTGVVGGTHATTVATQAMSAANVHKRTRTIQTFSLPGHVTISFSIAEPGT